MRGRLTRDELRAPRFLTVERLVESTLVRADGEESDDDDAECDPDDDPDHEGFHLCPSSLRSRATCERALVTVGHQATGVPSVWRVSLGLLVWQHGRGWMPRARGGREAGAT